MFLKKLEKVDRTLDSMAGLRANALNLSPLHYRNIGFNSAILKYLNKANPNHLLKANRIKRLQVPKNRIDRQKWHRLFTNSDTAHQVGESTVLHNDCHSTEFKT